MTDAQNCATMHEKVEYDHRLGGTVQLPDALQTFKFASDRVDEIKSLLGAIRNPNQTKLVFQTLPRHMRRRAMSHNPKRLPRKYRQAHVAQMRKSGMAVISKRPSRKYRRKASNLLKEYARRARKNIWLETHLWHAKRFHMIERWGYKLAQSSCDKMFRSCYRASAEHCLLQDISYVGAIEISGKLERIRDAFAEITNRECGLGVCAKTFVSGSREGSVELFRAGKYPLGAVGKVSFIWKPSTGDEKEDRVVWIFAHASFYRDVCDLLKETFGLSVDDGQKKYSDLTNGLAMMELKDTLNRFRLTGPLSQAVLGNAFKCKNLEANVSENWFKSYILSELGTAAHSSQSAHWQAVRTVSSPTDLVPNMVLALNIEDPRLNRPKKRTKSIVPVELNQIHQPFNLSAARIPEHSNVSALFDISTRKRIVEQKMSTSTFCQMRNKHVLVPGERCTFEDDMQPIPVLLIQRPGSENGRFKRIGYGCGWDVIIPAEYGISTWMCLIMWGARAGGLRETETICRESGVDEFLPDTLPAKYNADAENQRQRDEFFKKPPNKRSNYTKLSINSPFKCRWSQLVHDWSPQTSTATADDANFYVLRDKHTLQTIQQMLSRIQPITALGGTSVAANPNCLIPIHIKMSTRGNPDNCSLICLPKPSDLRRNQRKIKALDSEPVYTEPMRNDTHEPERKRLRGAHLRLLKRLRRRRVRAKRLLQQTATRRVLIAKPGTAKMVAEQLQRMRDLWLPSVVETVRHQCSREVFGYVTQTNFSLCEATFAGVGYITLQGLRKLVATSGKVLGGQKGGCQVLVRGTQTRQYRLATLSVPSFW